MVFLYIPSAGTHEVSGLRDLFDGKVRQSSNAGDLYNDFEELFLQDKEYKEKELPPQFRSGKARKTQEVSRRQNCIIRSATMGRTVQVKLSNPHKNICLFRVLPSSPNPPIHAKIFVISCSAFIYHPQLCDTSCATKSKPRLCLMFGILSLFSTHIGALLVALRKRKPRLLLSQQPRASSRAL